MNFMKVSKLFLYLVILNCVFCSCIRDEAPNQEADIISINLKGLKTLRKPIISNSEINIYVNGWEDITHIAPEFKLTEGATITPKSGTVRDFTTPQFYTVTSEDKHWKKTYKVSFLSDDIASKYKFENMKWYEYKDSWNPKSEVKKLFHIFYDIADDGKEITWGSGNSGFLFIANGATADKFPTSQDDNGYKGKCAKLMTVSAGDIGKNMKTPLAAGNLFMGSFELNFTNMAKSTHFGVPFVHIPKVLTGYYKYKAGKEVINKESKVLKGEKDIFDIYAVMYEVTPDTPFLDGTNSKTSKNIVLIAQLNNKREANEWTHFTINFKPVENRRIDMNKLKAGKYNIAIIMSSSQDGANFTGAIGSTLWVDEMELFYK